MKHHHLLASLALTLAAGACVEPADPVGTDPADFTLQITCQPVYTAAAPLPPFKAWQNALPADQGADQVWVTVAIDPTMSKYRMYQVNRQTLKVTWWTEFSNQERPYATYLAALRPGTQASIRNPPPPPWPPGDDWVTATAVVNLAMHIVGSHT